VSLEIATTFNALPVCPKCGWAQISRDFNKHVRDCPNVAAGTVAIELAAHLPELHSTKFGYGDGYLTFEPDDNMHVRLKCSNAETFKLEDVWLLGSLSIDEAADLVRALADWRNNCISRRGQAVLSREKA
jgi:hypothetical protein